MKNIDQNKDSQETFLSIDWLLGTHRKFHHQSVDNAAKNSDEVKSVPRIFEIALKKSHYEQMIKVTTKMRC